MTKLVNRAKMTTATTGTGTITLGSAVDGYQTFADAGVANSDVVRYVIEDGDAWEIGLGTYTASGTTLSRGSIESSNADNALNLTGNAIVYVSAAAADLQELVDFADNFVLPTADGSTGQVLQTNGAGTLSFTTISGYSDTDVDTHLNTGSASTGEVLSWTGTDYDWIAVSGGAFTADGSNNLYAISTLAALTTGTNNFAAGNGAGNALTSGSNNVAIGNGALDSATTGGRNIAIGQDAMGLGVATTASGDNVAIGYRAGYDLTSGIDNLLIGEIAGQNITTGTYNVAIGRNSLGAVTTTSSNVAVGKSSGSNYTGQYSVFVGDQSGFSQTTGEGQTFVGYQAGVYSGTGLRNIGIGQEALLGDATAKISGSYNTGIGYQTGNDLSTGANNFLGGYQAGTNLTTGSNNVAIGSSANDIGTINANTIVIGYNADPSSTTVSNEITLGNSSITNLRVPGVGFQFDTTDGLIVPKTVTAGGTTGAQTINKTAGTVNFAAAATSLVVTNSFVDANSIIIATVGTDDVTMKSVAVVAAAGSFTLYANAAATAETRVNWFVAN